MSSIDKQRPVCLKNVPDGACAMWRSLGPVLGALALSAVLLLPQALAAWADAEHRAQPGRSGAQRR